MNNMNSRKVYESGMEGRLGRGRQRPNSVWMDKVIKVLNDKGLTLEQARMTAYGESGVERICE